MSEVIRFQDVSKFYGEVLGVNQVDLVIEPGVTGLVGPNGSGKSTLLNLATGLLRPSSGSISVLGLRPQDSEELFRIVGYCPQFDAFPRGMTGLGFLRSFLALRGFDSRRIWTLAHQALERVGLMPAKDRRIAAYSKGMRQRLKIAHALAHEPRVLLLDEPLNGLDPMARAEIIDTLREEAEAGRFVLLSSHILHEIDVVSDDVVMLASGYVIAEGEIHGVREEITERPMQVFVRCDRPQALAARIFDEDHITEVRLHADGLGLHLRTLNRDALFLLVNRVVLEEELELQAIGPADDDVHAVYDYLLGGEDAS